MTDPASDPDRTPHPDVLLVSLGTTRGLQIADGQLAEMLREAAASVAVTAVRIGATDRLRRGYPVNDLVEALAARRALAAARRRLSPRAIIFSSTTAALLAPSTALPYAVWLDSPARSNRPGARNRIVHMLERRSLAKARRVLVLSEPALAQLPAGHAPALVIAPPLAPAPARTGPTEPLVVAYTPDPWAKGLALVCRTWAAADTGDARLVITGIEPGWAREFLARSGTVVPAGVELAGMLDRDAFAGLLHRARVFLSAADWEDFGQTPLQALDQGAALVCAPAGGPFPALALARELAPQFVAPVATAPALATALQRALSASEDELAAYRTEARERLEPYRREVQVRRLADEVLPALLDR
jgi:hypothetical protein